MHVQYVHCYMYTCMIHAFMYNPFLPPSLSLSQQSVSYTCQVSGPGLKSAIANHPTHVLVELRDSSGRPCSLQQNITAQLELIPQATPSRMSRLPWSKKTPHKTSLTVTMATPSQYKVLYTAVSRSQHKLHVQVNDREINGSPFTMTVYLDPTQLGRPVRIVTDLYAPYGIVYNSRGEMIVSECVGDRVSIIDNRGKKIRTFGSHGDSPDQMEHPRGIAIDDMDNIYVSSSHKLQKFTSNGKLIKCIGQKGGKGYPNGVTLHDNQVYMCDSINHHIQVFDLNLNFVRSIGSRGRGEFDEPHDVKFDTAGNIYVADYNNSRVQVLDNCGHLIRTLGDEGERKLSRPSGLHIANKYVYISDCGSHCIVVYETSGQFVTSFGRLGNNEGEFDWPCCITSCVDGFIHVCDFHNFRVQIF